MTRYWTGRNREAGLILIAWVLWALAGVVVTAIFYALYRYAESIERQEEREEFERAQRESYAQQLEEIGLVQEARWIREGRRWW